MLRYILILLVFVTIVCGCKHKTNFDLLAEVHYQTDIAPIISSNCTFSGCHGLVEKERFSLLNYNDLIKHCGVKAGSPETSKLYQIINTFNKNDIMPAKPYNQLSDNQIQLIYAWIGQGAKNN